MRNGSYERGRPNYSPYSRTFFYSIYHFLTESLNVRLFGPDSNVNSYDDFQLRCDVTGSPTPVITWYKDGKPIQMENTGHVLYGKNLSVTEMM